MNEPSSKPTRTGPPIPVGRYALVLGIVALVLALWGVIDRVLFRNALAREATEATAPSVITVKPTQGPATEELVLPGSVQAFIEAPIYARTSGYLRRWVTDIGAHVRQGELLAEIDAPEVDQQLHQAQADLATAQANSQLALTTNERWQSLLATHSVSQQDADAKAGDLAAKEAATKSANANVERLKDLESFTRVLAPFDGVITQRNTDVGALINPGSSSGSALFREADTHKLRVYVLVPEPYAASTRPGTAADLQFTEHPGQKFPASIVRTANALDPALRTLQVELQVDNADGELFPGAYAEVHFKLPASAAESLRVPINALLFRAQGMQVAAVSADNHVKLLSVTPGRDFGTSIEVVSGLDAKQDIIINPPDSLADGALVHVVPAPNPNQPPTKPASGK
ncbi:MAG: efflux RND transporter periplasmic adaptor subunit [Steroidobacteraceae bacterium]